MLHKENSKSTASATIQRFVSCVLGIMLVLSAVSAFAQNGHLHQLNYNNASWVDSDVTSLTGGDLPQPQGIAAFTTTPNNQLHVYYVSQNGGLHQAYFNGTSWSDENLTAVTGGTGPFAQSAVTGFSIGNAQYVYFCDGEFIHEYSYGDNANWNWVNTVLPGGGSSGLCSGEYYGAYPVGLVAFATTPNNQRHVYYQGTTLGNYTKPMTIRQLYFNGTTWSNENLSAASHGVKALAGSWMAGFSIGNFQYVFFTAPNGHIHQYSYVDNWADKDVTKAASGVPSYLGEDGIAAFVVPGTTHMEVYYLAGNNYDMHQMTFESNKWSDLDLTAITGGQPPITVSQLVAFATTPNNQFHLYYGGANSDTWINQYYFNGSYWSEQALPSATINGLFSGIAGFSIGNLQYVYYVSAN